MQAHHLWNPDIEEGRAPIVRPALSPTEQPPACAAPGLTAKKVFRHPVRRCAPATEPSRRRILVVDDQDTILSLLSDYLSLKGFDVRAAQTTPEALACIESWSPDLILTDVQMPCGGAAKILDYLDGRTARPFVLLMTGAELGWAQQVVREGRAEAALQKPLQLKVISDTVTHIRTWTSHWARGFDSREPKWTG
ncbi:MAG: response regulator [Acidobacteriota bacterium]